ncbi:thiamine pyrophosphate-binding protein [Catenulispora pinisilvae]|uniref:thiamine pyrophosphate-binding protein n=1 Tax=Catenulispora pinisilvae TaxID=2705253 RepID=UPI0018926464|nr:thiamine pyrophosphate-binding protein [Catenulispora pinisilvae]
MSAAEETVASEVGQTLREAGADVVFGVVGSGNFHVTNALIGAGARFVAARHEGGAATMADAYARASGGLGVLSVHQGPGLTNAMTGIAEAAKARTPLVVLAAEATSRLSNFWVDQNALARAVGALPRRIGSAKSARADTLAAVATAQSDRRTVILNLPLDVQQQRVEAMNRFGLVSGETTVHPREDDLSALTALVEAAERPVFIAGRGARLADAGEAIATLAERAGALLATSAAARGLFRGEAFDLDVSGGFATPLAAELIRSADLIVGWGCGLNMWTLRHGTLIAPDAKVVQVDTEQDALGRHRRLDLGVIGDAADTARQVAGRLSTKRGYRSREIADRLKIEGRWPQIPYADRSTADRIDPRTLSAALNELLPLERTVAVDSGNFMGYPVMYLDVPDAEGLVFTQAYQSIGLGLPTAIGAALARPDRLTVAALGDGGALMSIAELETAVRERLGLLIVVYNDAAYGAEVHHFGPHGDDLGTVTFPDTDIAAIARGFGCEGATVRVVEDLKVLGPWLGGARDRPLVLDAKVAGDEAAWWLEEAFRGH